MLGFLHPGSYTVLIEITIMSGVEKEWILGIKSVRSTCVYHIDLTRVFSTGFSLFRITIMGGVENKG